MVSLPKGPTIANHFGAAKHHVFRYNILIPLPRLPRRATYDENGNIVLHGDVPAAASDDARDDGVFREENLAWTPAEPPAPAEIFDAKDPVAAWIVTEDDAAVFPVRERLASVRSHITKDVLEEGIRQYRESILEAGPLLRELGSDTRSAFARLWSVLAQPVYIPIRRGTSVKQMSRGRLFVTDIFRFGATFALIFLGLFLSLNYQSFWQITTAHVAPFFDIPDMDDNRETASALQEKLHQLPMLATAGGGTEGDLLSALPQVGPPENRIIIPKLDLNVPLVNPSFQALLQGDWTQVEKDIQSALERGVVHYPGTANPGQAGNFFITGHSSYYPWAPGGFKTVFARLHNLQPGDEYWVYFGGDKHRYVVRSKKEVSPSDISVLDQPTDERIGTLMTCTPVGTTLRRLIVQSTEVDPVTGIPLHVGERSTRDAPAFRMESLPI
ncbi:MAG: sortase [Candidatus Peribacteraceae bacterium]|nr:sortase [Candidatus Peribacteraceae bacterium]